MKNCCLIAFFIITCSILIISCKNTPATDSVESKQTDSALTSLQSALYNDPDSVLIALNSLLKTREEPDNRAKILLLIASAQEIKGNYDSSIVNANKGLQLAVENTHLKAKLHNQLGVAYDYKSDYRNALEHYETALEYFEDEKDTSGYVKEYNNIAIIYWNTGDLQRAKEYVKKCLTISSQKK